MADTKITALAAITTVDPAADVLPIVDISDTSMAASGTTKKITSNQILGAGGTATLASATITGDLTVDTNVLKVDTTNDRVGIGTATPSQPLHVKLDQNAYTFSRIDNQNASSGAYAALMLSASGNSWGIRVGSAAANSNALDFILDAGQANSVKMTLNTAGNLAFPSGKGIDFSATAGTGTSELLNDYEEGTWTPTAGDASSGGNQATTATAVGRYTKVGRLVTVHFELTDINTTGLTAGNSLYIRGLPFTASSATTQYGTITGAGITFSGFLTCGVFNSTAFPIYATSTGGSLADIKVSGFASGTADIFGTLTYFV